MHATALVLAASFLTQDAPAPRPAETYDLDIADERIHRPDLDAATAVRVGDGVDGVTIDIGAGVSARAVDIHLRNVKGTVRFRFDTSRLRSLSTTLRRNP